MAFFAQSLLLLYLIAVPLLVCVIHSAWPELFRRGRVVLWALGMAVLSWCVANGACALIVMSGPLRPRGPEATFALLFGWGYLWVSAVPIVLAYIILSKIKRALAARTR